MSKIKVQGMVPGELEELITRKGYPSYHSEQIFLWIHGKGVRSFEDMTNLPQKMRFYLEEEAVLALIEPREVFKSDDGTEKILFSLQDGLHIEAVLLKYDDRISLCVSTQVGCRFNCPICATGKMGWQRNLSAAEIVEQVILAQNHLGRSKEAPRIRNIVFMGMGEPLDNLAAVLQTINILNHPMGMNIGSRRMTISTCGLVPEIIKLAEENLQAVLAVSLHAATNELRDKLVPINKKFPLEDLLAACKIYFEGNQRRISFEYAMINGINDSREDARLLTELLRGFPAHINLIPINPVAGTEYLPSPPGRINDFLKYLSHNSSLDVSLREVKGRDIKAACGQLYPLIKGEL